MMLENLVVALKNHDTVISELENALEMERAAHRVTAQKYNELREACENCECNDFQYYDNISETLNKHGELK